MRKYIILITIVVFLFSCSNDFLELTPVSDASSENFFQSASDFEVAVNGIYSAYQEQGYYGDFWRYMMEFRSDNIDDVNSGRNAGQDANINKFREVPSNTNVEAVWVAMYQVIARANTVLTRIENVDMDEALKRKLIA